MAFNGSGTFNRVMSWVNDAAAGIKIRADRHDTEDNGFAAGLSNTICRDGQSTILADIPFNAKRITNLGDPVNAGDALNKQWAQANLISGAYVADTPPAAAQAGNLWWDSDSGNLFLKFNDGTSTQWVQVNIGTGIPEPPSDGNDYTRVNGEWRLKEQHIDLSGKTQQDIPVPAWAQMVELTGTIYGANATNQIRVSGDGATFSAGAGDYSISGPIHYTGSTSYSAQAVVAGSAMVLANGTDSTTIPVTFKNFMGLTRATTAQYFPMKMYSVGYSSNAALAYTTQWYTQLGGGPAFSQLRIAALRLLVSPAAWGASSNIHLRWS